MKETLNPAIQHWKPYDGDPFLELLLKYLSEEDQVTIVAQVLQQDIAMKEKALDIQKMALKLMKKGRNIE
jgi:hypothetical protein